MKHLKLVSQESLPFADAFDALRAYVEQRQDHGSVTQFDSTEAAPWPRMKKDGIVLKNDMAVELGSPQYASTSYLVWTQHQGQVQDGLTTLIGPDLAQASEANLSFGKVVLLEVDGFDEANCRERHRELELLRLGLHLSGYMLRAASQEGREWSRVSKEALSTGFSLATLGNALIELYRSVKYVKAVEVLFVTSSKDDVGDLRSIGAKAKRQLETMPQPEGELELEDCDSCEYTDICDEVDGLKQMRHSHTGG